MQPEWITAEEYARQSRTDITFINLLGDNGLIEVIIQENTKCIPLHQLQALEKYTRLHFDLDINLEGIEAISHLLQKITALQEEINSLRSNLRLYEPL